MQRVAIVGASGLVGRRLVEHLSTTGIHVVATSRRGAEAWPAAPAGVTWQRWDGCSAPDPGWFADCDAIVNLAGEGIAEARWSAQRRAALTTSRVEPTRHLANLKHDGHTPVLINASAVGWYGGDGAEVDERSPRGAGFMAELCGAWEAATESATGRVVCLRFGMIIDEPAAGGALAKMLAPWQPIAVLSHGRQPVPWLHVDDAVGMIVTAIDNPQWSGPVNAVAPEQADNRALTKALAQATGRRVFPLAVPGWVLRLRFGAMADVILCGDHVRPTTATALGYAYRHPSLLGALQAAVPATATTDTGATD